MAATVNGIQSPQTPFTALKEFLESVKQFSEHPSFKDVETLAEEVASLKNKVREHEETMLTASKELVREKEEKDSQERSWNEKYHQGIAEVLQVHNKEVNAAKDERSVIEDQLTDMKTQLQLEIQKTHGFEQTVKDLELQKSQYLKETKEIKTKLAVAEDEGSKLRNEVKGRESRSKTDQDLIKRQNQAIKDVISEREELEAGKVRLEAQLKEQGTTLKKIKGFAPALSKDDVDQAYRSIDLQGIWQRCLQIVEQCFETEIPPATLNDAEAWRSFKAPDREADPIPLPPSNTPEAKQMRVFVTLAIIADSLTRNIFTATYLLLDDSEMGYVLFHKAVIEAEKEAFFRRLLNSIAEDKEEHVIELRINRVISEVLDRTQKLLGPEISAIFGSELQTILKDATKLWKSMQRRISHFEADLAANLDVSWDWTVVRLTGGDDRIRAAQTVPSSVFAQDEAALVLFPRVFIIDGTADKATFPGVVLLKSHVAAASKELQRIRLSSPTLGRSSTNRSMWPRRGMSLNVQTEGNFGVGVATSLAGSFLGQAQSGAGSVTA